MRKNRILLFSILFATLVIIASLSVILIFNKGPAYLPHDPIRIEGNSGFSTSNGIISGSGTASDPYIIAGWEINTTTADGIRIENTDAFFVLQNVSVKNGGRVGIYGIFLYNVVNAKIVYNDCTMSNYGIRLISSSKNILSNNNCSNNQYGIFVESSSNNTISNNNCSEALYGICLNESESNIVVDNLCSWNECNIVLDSSRGNSIRMNDCLYGIDSNIYLNESSDNRLSENRIYTIRHGIYISSGMNNTIWNNTFWTYGDGILSHAYDNGTNNHWNSTDGYGNHWDDWTAVDLPYTIAGSAGAKDYHPLSRAIELHYMSVGLNEYSNFKQVP